MKRKLRSIEIKCKLIPVLKYFFYFDLLLLSIVGNCQNLIISSGTSFSGSGGTLVLSGNVINHGFFNNDNTIVFSGSNQLVGGDSPSSFNNLTINSGTTVSLISAGNTLKGILLSNGILNSDGNLTLLSSETGTALIDGRGTGQVSGYVTMQRYFPAGFGYKYISSPFTSSTVSELSDELKPEEPFPVLFRYDESRTVSGWVDYTAASGILHPLNGYAANLGESPDPRIIDIQGIVNNGDLSITLYNHNYQFTEGFNLIGNPYPSPIDWDSPSGWTKINIDNALYFFKASDTDMYGGSYVTYMDGISSDGLASSIIPSMQGFFIHVTDGDYPVTGILGTTNEVRITNLDHPFIKSDHANVKPLLRLVAGYENDTVSYDPLVIYFDSKATINFDGQCDALKLFNTDFMVTNFYSFSEDGSRLSINGLPLDMEESYSVRLGIKTEMDGTVIFKIKNIEGNLNCDKIILTDTVTHSNQDLLHNNIYKVNLQAGHYQERFYLNLIKTKTGINDYENRENDIKIFSFKGNLTIRINRAEFTYGTLTIYNLSGQSLYKNHIMGPGEHKLNPPLRNGFYIVTLTFGSDRVTEKVIFNNN